MRHGAARRGRVIPEYRAWADLIQRCTNPKNPQWRLYGGRGITVCRCWRESFALFLVEVGPRPGVGYSIDRIDPEGGYWCGHRLCPECGPFGRPRNVRWADRRTQNRNRRNCRVVTLDGQTLPMAEWIERKGLPASTVHSRIRLGWTAERALTTPTRARAHVGTG